MHVEPKVMSQIAELLEQLDAPARSRVIAWAISALDVQVPQPKSSGMVPSTEERAALADEEDSHSRFARHQRFSVATEDWLIDEDYTIL